MFGAGLPAIQRAAISARFFPNNQLAKDPAEHAPSAQQPP